MRSKLTNVTVTDFKDNSGLWVKSFNPEPYVRLRTRAYVLWLGVNHRCKVGGSCQKSCPTYVDCVNGFKDFQEFAEWCQTQYGYTHKDKNGKHWQLDKDLILYGNKVYSKETCIFVPQRVNKLLIASNAKRGEWPLGVYLQRNKFLAQCWVGSKQRHLGSFNCELEAHQAWQRAKIDVIRRTAIDDLEIAAHVKLVPILLEQAQRIEDDLLNNRETK